MSEPWAVDIQGLTHRYKERVALDQFSLRIQPGEIFALLGPNGSGKSTLFRVLTTLAPIQEGQVSILGHDSSRQGDAIREEIGIVFQSPGLDRKLTVLENVRFQGAMYGISGPELSRRVDDILQRFSLTDRAGDTVETLSGGLRRRVELAKGLIHSPRLVLLDEPSTGLDPAARNDLWQMLVDLRRERDVTVVLTTHILDEAEKADRLAILDQGRLVALDTPDNLRASVGGDAIVISTANPESLIAQLNSQFHLSARLVDGAVRLEVENGHEWIARIAKTFAAEIRSITLGRPTLEDVFIAKTGHRFRTEEVTVG